MPANWQKRFQAAAVLFFLQFCSFGIFVRRLGFYHDDWVFLEDIFAGGASFCGKLQAAAAAFWSRPVQVPFLAVIAQLSGMHPARYQAIFLILGTVETWLLYLLIEQLTESHALALLAAALAAVYPNREVTHFWLCDSMQTAAQILILGSLLAHLNWLRSKSLPSLASSLFLYLISMLCYESGTFMPLLLAGGLAVRRRNAGTKNLVAGTSAMTDIAPYALPFLAGFLIQWAGLPALTHIPNQKNAAFHFSIAHVFKAYGAGFECISNRVLHACFLGLKSAAQSFSPLRWIACILFGVISAILIAPATTSSSEEHNSIRVALGMALFGFLGSYGPYALSGTYMPRIFGVMSRTNGTGAWIGGLLVACAVMALLRSDSVRKHIPPRTFGSAILALLLIAFTWTNWNAMLQWNKSWQTQQDILAKLHRKLAPVQGPADILLTDFPSNIGDTIVFSAIYDFDAALRLYNGRQDLKGVPLRYPPLFGANEVTIDYRDGTRISYPYTGLYLYRYRADTLERVVPPSPNLPSRN